MHPCYAGERCLQLPGTTTTRRNGSAAGGDGDRAGSGYSRAHSIANNIDVGVDHVVGVPTFTRRDSRCAGSSMNLWNKAANAIANAAANNTAHGFPSVR